jgi:hypothetical protein
MRGALLLVALTLPIALVEIFARVTRAYVYIPLLDCAVPLTKSDAELGHISLPNQRNTIVRPCYVFDTLHNSLGFRGPEWDTGASRKIAILGDSFMEAVRGGPEGSHTASILKQLLGAEVLNTGIGSYNTVSELAVYRRFVKRLSPDVVLLFFYGGNDAIDNSCATLWGNDVPCGYYDHGQLRFKHQTFYRREYSGLRLFLRQRSATYCLLARVRATVQEHRQAPTVPDAGGSGREESRWNAYLPVTTPAWRDAWSVTEAVLAQLKSEVEADGSHLVLVPVPEYIEISPAWRKEVKEELKKGLGTSEVPASFEPTRPAKILRAIAERQNIQMLELQPVFARYRDRFALARLYRARSI